MTPWPTQKYSFVAMLQDEIDTGGSPLYGMVARKFEQAMEKSLIDCVSGGTGIIKATVSNAGEVTMERIDPDSICRPQSDPAEFRPFSEVPEKDGVYQLQAENGKHEYLFSKYSNGIWHETSTVDGAKNSSVKSYFIYAGRFSGWREIQEQGQ